MPEGSVLVAIAIDHGGCFEGSRPTTHDDPVFRVHRSLFYCVANMPGAVARTATQALGNVTMPHLLALADKGWRRALTDDAHLRAGLSVHEGQLTSPPVGEALGLEAVTPASMLGL